MPQQDFYRVYVASRIEQVCGKGVPKGMGGIFAANKSRLHHRGVYDGLQGTTVQGFALIGAAFKNIFLAAVLAVVMLHIRQHGGREQGKPILGTLSQPYFDAIVLPIYVTPLQVPELIEAHARAIQQANHDLLSHIRDGCIKPPCFFLRHHLGKRKHFSRIQRTRQHKRLLQHFLEKETATVRHTTAFGPAHAVNTLDENDVLRNVLLGDVLHILLVVVVEQMAKLHHVTSHRLRAVIAHHHGTM